ncbi:hypothetical protein BC941DRAFT_375033, partial [Chlamydoabsidia padenii]
MVYSMQLVQGTEFKINLETDHIILHGSEEESGGVMLRGSVVLNCQEAIKVRSVTLKLEGKIKVNWLEGRTSRQRQYKEERTIIEHEWTLISHTRKAYHLDERHYQWDFELPLPGDLPETLHHELGQVYYRLKAVVERPTFSLNYSDRRSLKVTRLRLPTCMELLQSTLVSSVWADKLSYDINVPTRCYSIGSILPITFDFLPLHAGLKIRSVTCTLKEYLTLSTSQGHSKTIGRVVKVHHNHHFQHTAHRLGPAYHKTEQLVIPQEDSHLVMMDTANDLINVKHKLKLTVSLMNADGHISELRAAIPIVIAALSTEEDALPTYENAWRSARYDPPLVQSLAIRQTASPLVNNHAMDFGKPR